MKVSFLAGQWKGVLKTLAPIASSNKTNQSWKMLLVNPKTQMLTASNEQITILSKVQMESDSQAPFLIESARLASVVSTLDDDAKVTLDVSDSEIIYKSGRSRYKLGTLPEKDYARKDKPTDMSSYLIPSNTLKRAIENTLGFVGGASESRNVLKGVNFKVDDNAIVMTATNGHYLSNIKFNDVEMNKHESGVGMGSILPPELLKHALRMTSESPKLMLYLSDNKSCISTPTQMVWSNVIDGKFPDVTNLLQISSKDNSFKPNVSEWQASITRIKPLLDVNKVGRVLISNADGVMKMAVSNDIGDSEEYIDGIEVSFKDDVILDLKYLDNVLRNQSDVEVIMPCDGVNHAHFISESDNFQSHQLISPMRA